MYPDICATPHEGATPEVVYKLQAGSTEPGELHTMRGSDHQIPGSATTGVLHGRVSEFLVRREP